jgi:hypothetical protein
VEVEVALLAVAVVPDVQRGAAGEAADGALGLVVDDVNPQGAAPVAGVAVVKVEGLLVGERRDDAAGQALLPGVARVVVEDLLAGEDPQFPSANPTARSAVAARSAASASVRMATRKPRASKTIGLAARSGSWSVVPTGRTIASSAGCCQPSR